MFWRIRDLLFKETSELYTQERMQAFFENQKDSVKAIANTEWYRQIKMYRARELDAAASEFAQLKTSNVADYKFVQAKIQLATGFLTYLNNLWKVDTFQLEDPQ